MAQISRCVVSGGAGFIGSYLCDALLAQGLSVICLDNLLTGSEDNLVDAQQNPAFRFIKHDVSLELPELSGVNYVFHLASPGSVIDYQKYPEETALVNSLGTRHLLELARRNQAKFLLASTSEIYGDPQVHPQPESYWGNVNPVGVRACYDEAKRFAEMLTMVYFRKYTLNTRIVRIFNTYGPRMRKDDGRVVSNFINQALEGKSITIYGNGHQTRSFCYISDLISGLVAAAFRDSSHGEIFNLGNPEECTVIDLAQKIKEMTGSVSQLVYQPLPEDDPGRRRPDITRAQQILHWSPMVSVTSGLEKTIEYYRAATR